MNVMQLVIPPRQEPSVENIHTAHFVPEEAPVKLHTIDADMDPEPQSMFHQQLEAALTEAAQRPNMRIRSGKIHRQLSTATKKKKGAAQIYDKFSNMMESMSVTKTEKGRAP